MTRWLTPDVTVIGGGLAGCEAAWQLAERGARVALMEMKPAAFSPAHQTPLLCELVCSNSLRSDDPMTGVGLLKRELRQLGSLVMACADAHRVPAGSALAVERFGFGRAVTARLAGHPGVRIERRVLDALPDGPTICATGPLTGGGLARVMRKLCGGDRLYFYDAIAPIVHADSVDMSRAFRASRWGKGESDNAGDDAGEAGCGDGGDYVNCPLTRDEYYAFVSEIRTGKKLTPHPFEEPRFFEGCLPIEVMADRGDDVLRYGPMRPVGLDDPRTGRWPFAVVQLRTENRYATAYNLVGFQTRLTYPEQNRILRIIPALADAEFLRFGSIHRNTYIDAPALLGPEFELRDRPDIQFAGLVTGVEGYIESCAIGLLAALFAAARRAGAACPPPPATTALGGLHRHVTTPRGPGARFSPTNINWGLLPPLGRVAKKRDRKRLLAERADVDLARWLADAGLAPARADAPAARPPTPRISA